MIPVIFYDVLFIIVNITYSIIRKEVYNQGFSEKRKEKRSRKFVSFNCNDNVILPLILLGIFWPELTILLFMDSQ
ncbi:hypothetical protein ALNOE001_05000 [Candidatus Methanobinarius endosymbioticus]|uniref:Uncharacterized protein n=1 Tax=Candidatus Methanobinarius endosymbioticus TaxID=2006182 RepID=A0A366MEV7_9EURY|nr:hypothetical protein ALNOE001_05000 [Candidatus Methanobinarius endosymbioticus]